MIETKTLQELQIKNYICLKYSFQLKLLRKTQ